MSARRFRCKTDAEQQKETGDKWEFQLSEKNCIIMRSVFIQFQNILETFNQMF